MMNYWRDIMIGLDSVIYGAVQIILQLIMDLSTQNIFSPTLIAQIRTRIYIILGLIMAFRLIIAAIQMLVNPDQMDDKEKGMGGLLKRVVIALVLIVLVPEIFHVAIYDIQPAVIKIIPSIVLGKSFQDTGDEEEERNGQVGRIMAYYSFLPFFVNNPGCEEGTLLGTGGDGSSVVVSSVPEAAKVVNTRCEYSEDGYAYNYRWLISAAAGVYLVWVLVSVAVAVAIRTIKLALCEIIAPIPISSYIDPKTSKSTFDNWVSITLKTYADLFIRLLLVYIVMEVFVLIFGIDANSGQTISTAQAIIANLGNGRGTLVILFLIVGLLQFVKQLPKFISDMLGIKEGFGDMSGMFKSEGWKSLASTAGMVTGTASSGVSAVRNAWSASRFNDPGRSKLQRGLLAGFSAANALRHGLTTAGRTAFRGAAAVSEAKNKKFKEAYKSNYHVGDQLVKAQFSKLDTKKQARQNNREQNSIIADAENNIENIRNQMGSDYNTRLSAARNARNAALADRDNALADRDNARALRDNAQTAIDTENENYIQQQTNLTNRRDVYSNYADILEKRNAAGDAVMLMRESLRNAVTEDDKLIARRGLEAALNEYQNYDRELNKIMTDNQGRGFNWGVDINQARNNVHDAEVALTTAENTHQQNLQGLQTDFDYAQSNLDAAQFNLDNAIEDLNAESAIVSSLEQLQTDLTANQRRIIQAEGNKIHLGSERVQNAWQEFIGNPVPKGQNYIDLASHTRGQKSSLFTGEAFNKIEENASLLATTGGDVFTYSTKAGDSFTASFVDMINARSRLNSPGSNGQVEIDIRDGNGNVTGSRTLSASEFAEYFKDAQKKAGVAYVDRVINGFIDNSTISNSYKREIQYIRALPIPVSEQNALVNEIEESYGRYLMSGTDRAEAWETKGTNLKMHEDLLNGSNNNGQ